MLRDAEPVGAACLSGSRRAGTAGLEGRARLAPTMHPATRGRSAPQALPRTRATYGIPARPVGTTPPMTPSPISPIAALIDTPLIAAPLPRLEAITMPAGWRAPRQPDVPEMHEVAQGTSTIRTRRPCNPNTVSLTPCG